MDHLNIDPLILNEACDREKGYIRMTLKLTQYPQQDNRATLTGLDPKNFSWTEKVNNKFFQNILHNLYSLSEKGDMINRASKESALKILKLEATQETKHGRILSKKLSELQVLKPLVS